MEIYDLKVFMAVVETGGFTVAAKKLNCVQPNVTARIKKLEEILTVKLFYRENRGVTLTANGRDLIAKAKQIIRLAKETEAGFSQKNISGIVNIGVSQTAASAWLPQILKEFMEKYPEVELNTRSLFVETMIVQLLNHELDCALTDIQIQHPKLTYSFSRSEPLMLVSGINYPMSAEKEVTVLSFSKASQYRKILYTHLQTQQFTVKNEIILKGMDAVLSCIIGGVGISLLPASVAALAHVAPHINARPVDCSEGRVGVVSHVNNAETSAQQAFTDLAREIIM